MAEEKKVSLISEMGGNLDKLRKDVKKAADQILKLKDQRAKIGEDIRSIKNGLVDQGISKRALDRALQDYEREMRAEDPEEGRRKRQGDDEAYCIAREAMGLPGQIGLFD